MFQLLQFVNLSLIGPISNSRWSVSPVFPANPPLTKTRSTGPLENTYAPLLCDCCLSYRMILDWVLSFQVCPFIIECFMDWLSMSLIHIAPWLSGLDFRGLDAAHNIITTSLKECHHWFLHGSVYSMRVLASAKVKVGKKQRCQRSPNNTVKNESL